MVDATNGWPMAAHTIGNVFCPQHLLTLAGTVAILAAGVGQSAGLRSYLNYTGDIMLGALFPIHKKGSVGVECGRIQLEDGIQPLEAALYTIKQINKNDKILPGVNLGMIAFDSCDNAAYALEQSLDFVKGFIAHFNEHHETEFQCLDGSMPKFRGGSFDQVVAVIGAQSSSVTIQVATMLRLFKVPQVSYLSTSPSLSNQDRFPYFFRTVPSDINQAHVMLAMLSQFNWTYVSVIYSDNDYGNHGFETLSTLAGNYSVCFSTPQRIDKDRFTADDYDRVIHTLVNKTNVRVVVVFAEKTTTMRLLDAAHRNGAYSRFIWIGSDAWSNRVAISQRSSKSSPVAVASRKEESANDDEPHFAHLRYYQEPPAKWMDSVLEGSLAVQPLVRPLDGFDEYFTSLTPEEHSSINPWFSEFWQESFRCKIDTASTEGPTSLVDYSEGTHGEDYPTNFPHLFTDLYSSSPDAGLLTTSERPRCDPDLRISSARGYKQQRYLHFVRDAVYSIAIALHNMFIDFCGPDYYGLCAKMRHIEGEELREYIRNVSFNDVDGKLFKFKDGRDGPPRYSILNFQKDDDEGYHWKPVGNYSIENGSHVINIDHEAIKFRQGDANFPEASCGKPCASDQIKIRDREDMCCWRCRTCSFYQFKKDEFHCDDCPKGQLPSSDYTYCEDIPEKVIDFKDPWALGAMAIALFGVILTIAVGLVFWYYGDTPVIKASGRELSSLLLLGTLASFLVTFVLVGTYPTPFSCGLSRFSLGLCHSLCYAAILTKTNRIARIFNYNHSAPHKTKYTSPQSQLVITGLLTSVEIVVNASWLLSSPPAITHVFPDRETRLRVCLGLADHSYIVGLAYPLFLVLLCVVYAARTRKCPGGFNEARYVAFTSYTAIVVWLAFVPLYIASTSQSIRVVTLAISLSLSGLVQLGCLFFPKMYIVLFKPEKNTKEIVMAQHRSSSYVPSPSISNPMIMEGSGDSCSYIKPPPQEVVRMDHLDAQQFSTSLPKIWRLKSGIHTVVPPRSSVTDKVTANPSANELTLPLPNHVNHHHLSLQHHKQAHQDGQNRTM
ncbi:metabotropic glutamate receptor 2-like isoform X2 [Ischnura elegans]|uniref:metabotropic glutamate receptor 2-like isoform X2 n=1 Tax=Ischnura elegans TaxID=197161 RepID=UPI001ED8743D|nr:metabotropic glutamate receptor 2-like isoform X2 [Ischnura elegans]